MTTALRGEFALFHTVAVCKATVSQSTLRHFLTLRIFSNQLVASTKRVQHNNAVLSSGVYDWRTGFLP
jgi:hypothetical protein